MAFSQELLTSHEGRKHIFSENYSKTQPVSQLLGRSVMEKSQNSGPFGKYQKWDWAEGSSLGTEFEETIFPLEETVLSMISSWRKG